MNSAEHFKAAEHLLSEASFTVGIDDLTPISSKGTRLDPITHASLIARAHVHAILALDADDIAARAAS